MIGLGFLALKGGLRFTVYDVPINALGLGYIIFLISKYLSLLFDIKIKRYSQIAFISIGTILAIYPNVTHIIEYRVPVVFDKTEVQILDNFKKIAKRDDYVLTWWDYGYPIRYYSDVNTLVDGGKHSGNSNYPVSFALSYPNIVASANMARLNVEYTEKGFSSIEKIVEEYGFAHPNQFLEAINSKEFKLPEKTRDIYYYLPLRMLDIFPTVKLFSNLDLVSGITHPNPNFFQATAISEDEQSINLSNGIRVLKPNAKINYNGQEASVNELTLQIGNQYIPIKKFLVTAYDKDMKLTKGGQLVNQNGALSVIYMQSYQKFLILDDTMLDSAYIRLFVLEDYDRELFEEVILSPVVKIFKLKR
jgi:dolichyl-diphosphooligosaccharide--protein glycosyltransferase/undecaprenyl-diphosphooligosaccharide--protein glycosyltransferase